MVGGLSHCQRSPKLKALAILWTQEVGNAGRSRNGKVVKTESDRRKLSSRLPSKVVKAESPEQYSVSFEPLTGAV